MRGDYDSADVQDAFVQLHNTVFLLENEVSGAMTLAEAHIRRAYLLACFRKCDEITRDVQKFKAALRRELETVE